LFSKDGAKTFRRFFNDHILDLLPLDKNGVKMYHSSQCILGYEPFDKLSTPEREQIVDLMVEGIKKSVSLGVVILMPKDSYSSAIKTSPDVRSLAGDEYSQCLTRCIEYNADWLDQKKIAGRIEYVIEAGCNHQKEATAILAGISNSPELKRRYRLHDYSFRDKGPHIPQIFTPDLLAWEWQRAHINAMNPQRGEWRLTLKKLFDGTPHIPRYLTSISVGIRSLINAFYGVTEYDGEGPFHIKIQ